MGRESGKKVRSSFRAENAPTNGKDAFIDVAKPGGFWNWAACGPDPEALPLIGGGCRGVKELVDTVTHDAAFVGLFRMSFVLSSGEVINKWIFFQVEKELRGGPLEPVAEAATVAKEGPNSDVRAKLEEAVTSFVCGEVSLRIKITSKVDCTVENFLQQLHAAETKENVKLLTKEAHQLTYEQRKKDDPIIVLAEEVQDQLGEKAKEIKAKVAPEFQEGKAGGSAATLPRQATESRADLTGKSEVSLLGTPTVAGEEGVRLRKKVKPYKVGDLVDIFRSKQNDWLLDGEVVEVANDAGVKDGTSVTAGSCKVTFNAGKEFKWVQPAQFEASLRISGRPRPPEMKTGVFSKETHNWWWVEWNERYFELKKGVLSWWTNEAAAKAQKKPSKTIYLLGMQYNQDNNKIKVRTAASGSLINHFMWKTSDEAEDWGQAFVEQAVYCEDLLIYQKDENVTRAVSQLDKLGKSR